MSEVQLKIDGNKGFFYIDVNGNQEAMMTFFLLTKIKLLSTTQK